MKYLKMQKYTNKFLEPCGWDMIYSSTSAETSSTMGYGWADYTTGATTTVSYNKPKLYAKYWGDGTTASTCNSSWIQIDNGYEQFGEPCSTAVMEWAWATDGEQHECTRGFTRGYIKQGVIYQHALTDEEKKELNNNKLRQIIQSRCAPNFVIRDSRKALVLTKDVREQRARETLRRVVGESKFLNYVKNGFISVKAPSGLIYQIFPGHGITSVFDQGKQVERLCVVLNGDFPPTDSLIMRYILILNNEDKFRNLAIKHSISQTKSGVAVQKDHQSLTEIFKELKKAA